MGQQNSKNSHSYDVAPKRTFQMSEEKLEVEEPKPKVDPPTVKAAPAAAPTPVINSELVPKWINEAQFVDILRTNVDQFSKIQSFSAKPAMSTGENYASLMLRVSIDVELIDKTTKRISYMMKVPHENAQMEKMLEVANFFTIENAAYIDILPKLENLYKSKGLDITFAPRAYKFNEAEPKLVNTVLMTDLGPDGFKNLNRLDGFNMEQTKFVLRKMAQYHAASAHYVTVHGLYEDMFIYGMMGKDNPMAKVLMDGFFGPNYKAFLANLKNYKNGDKYYDQFEKLFSDFSAEYMKLRNPNPNQFNVLNHGDCWVNNFLFKHSPTGDLSEMLFVDFQNPNYGSPVQDLQYFIMTSVKLEHKLNDFEYFIRYYHDNLVEHLKLLEYPKDLPTLRELQMKCYENGFWSVFGAFLVLPVVVLDPMEGASFENFIGDSDTAVQFKNVLYSSKRYCTHIEKILPWLDNRGLLDICESPKMVEAQEENVSTTKESNTNQELDWLDFSDFKDIIATDEPKFDKIIDGTIVSACKPGDNYASKLLKIDINIQLKDNSTKTCSYILKVATNTEMESPYNVFPKENEMYSKYIPAFDQLYRDAGLPVTFGAKSYKFSKQIEVEYILMENLQPRGFTMCDRMKGLDMEHTKCVLTKLAQFHAASLRYKELHGPYSALYNTGIFKEELKELFESLREPGKRVFLDCVSKFDGVNEYFHKLEPFLNHNIQRLLDDAVINENEFNVLNHGDAWLNNAMFQYDEAGLVKETYLLDHQMSKYGNPAQDLYYFMMSSTQLDIKVEKFDYLIRWYHEQLVEHVKILKYSGFVPNLKELHIILLKHPIFAFATVNMTMAICLAQANDNFSMEKLMSDDSEAEAIRREMYGNERYKAHFETIVPWLNKRGLLDFEEPDVKSPELLSWLNINDFNEIIAVDEPAIDKIISGTIVSATKPGDNYASKMLKVDINAQLKDNSLKSYSYMLKVQPSSMNMDISPFNMFPKENEMYGKYLPAFEQLYSDAGLPVTFGAKSYKFSKQIEDEYILMENLQPRGFKMCDRMKGLDMEHTKCVLTKLAQFHAASLRYKELHGAFPALFERGVFKEETRDMFKSMFKPSREAFLETVSKFDGADDFMQKLGKPMENFVDLVIEDAIVKEDEFNVLNHGDAWLNNIMFQYDEAGHVKETYLLDHQVPKYGSPAQDLYYFLMSSTQLDIKIDQFDFLIRWYHEQLLEHAKILKYSGFVPDLKELHAIMINHRIHGVGTVFGTLTLCLAQATDDFNLDSFGGDSPAARAMRTELYGNERYRVQFEKVMPWMNNRGLLDLE